MNLERKHYEAMVRLRGNADFGLFKDVLREYMAEAIEQLKNGDGNLIYKAQGAARVLERVLDLDAKAPETLDKLPK